MLVNASEGKSTYPLVLDTFVCSVCSTLVRDVPEGWWFAPTISIFHPVELLAPQLNRMRKPTQEDSLDPLIQFGNPLLEIRITLQVQAINLDGDQRESQAIEKQTHSGLDLAQQLGESFCSIRTTRQLFDCPSDVLV